MSIIGAPAQTYLCQTLNDKEKVLRDIFSAMRMTIGNTNDQPFLLGYGYKHLIFEICLHNKPQSIVTTIEQVQLPGTLAEWLTRCPAIIQSILGKLLGSPFGGAGSNPAGVVPYAFNHAFFLYIFAYPISFRERGRFCSD